MQRIAVHQFHSGSAVGDAVTNAMFYVKELLAEAGIASDIFCEHVDPALARRIRPLAALQPGADDVVILHHSMGHEIIHRLEALPGRKILFYHNITPPCFFDAGNPFRHYAQVGLDQLGRFRGMVAGACAVSAFNAADLARHGFEAVAVIPALRDVHRLATLPFTLPKRAAAPQYRLLFVGRICAHKAQLELVQFMAKHRDSFDRPLHLTLVGHFEHDEGYVAAIRDGIAQAGLGDRVTLTGRVGDRALLGHYRAADAFVSMSRHEGFGVPLIEAMAFDCPVLGFRAAAVPETLGEAGVLLETGEPDELAARLGALLPNVAAQREQARRQRARLERFRRARLAEELRAMLAPHLPAAPASDPRRRHRRSGESAASE
jgi:glycosyltransferase involved in cell wall biosynthesis